MKRRNTVWAGLALVVGGLLTSCGGNSTPAATDESATAAPAEQEEIGTTKTGLGTFLVDGEGKALYVFTKDPRGKSVCEGDCLAAWPAVSEKVTAGTGVDQSLLGTITRRDGSSQVTYAGRPLYYYASDQAAGQVNGQGVSNVWYVISPAGQVIKSTATSSGSGGGY